MNPANRQDWGKLAAVRERLVQDCLKEKDPRKPLQDCQDEFARHGDSTTGPNMNLIRGLYYDLLQRNQAVQAWRIWKESQSRK
jgi:hypothetical protein